MELNRVLQRADEVGQISGRTGCSYKKFRYAGFLWALIGVACPGLSYAQDAAAVAPAAAATETQAVAVTDAAVPSDDDGTSTSLDEIKKLVEGIALYPDVLVAQILPASTYPVDVVEAYKWVEANPLDAAKPETYADKTWDPSVKALVPFPDVLKKMNDNIDWTNQLGGAFLYQSDDVFAAIQDLRAQAKAAGALTTNEQQTVEVTSTNNIEIQPTNPEVIYVPQYDPQVIYQTEYVPYPQTQVVYSDPGYYSGGAYPVYPAYGAGLLTFGAGVAVGAILDNNIDWDDCYVSHHGYHHWDSDDWDDWGNNWNNKNNNNNNIKINTGDININKDKFFNDIDRNTDLSNIEKINAKDSFNKLDRDKQGSILANYNKMDPAQREDAFKNRPNNDLPGRADGKPGGDAWQRNPDKPRPSTLPADMSNFQGRDRNKPGQAGNRPNNQLPGQAGNRPGNQLPGAGQGNKPGSGQAANRPGNQLPGAGQGVKPGSGTNRPTTLPGNVANRPTDIKRPSTSQIQNQLGKNPISTGQARDLSKSGAGQARNISSGKSPSSASRPSAKPSTSNRSSSANRASSLPSRSSSSASRPSSKSSSSAFKGYGSSAQTRQHSSRGSSSRSSASRPSSSSHRSPSVSRPSGGSRGSSMSRPSGGGHRSGGSRGGRR